MNAFIFVEQNEFLVGLSLQVILDDNITKFNDNEIIS